VVFDHRCAPDRACSSVRVAAALAHLDHEGLRGQNSEATTGTSRPRSPVLPKPEVADLDDPAGAVAEPELPDDLVDHEPTSSAHRRRAGPVRGSAPRRLGDTVVVDLVADDSGERDYVVELGSGRFDPGARRATRRMSAGETKEIELEQAGEAEPVKVEAVVKEIKEKVLPELDDELARSASEFDTIDELRDDIEQRIREQIEAEVNEVCQGARRSTGSSRLRRSRFRPASSTHGRERCCASSTPCSSAARLARDLHPRCPAIRPRS